MNNDSGAGFSNVSAGYCDGAGYTSRPLRGAGYRNGNKQELEKKEVEADNDQQVENGTD